MESWEARTSIQNRAAVDPLIFSLIETSKKDADLVDLPVTLE